MPDDQRGRLSIATVMVLTAGAAMGLSLLRIAHQTGSIPFTIGYVVYGFYFAVSGMTIAAIPLILRDRFFRRISWGIGSHCLFVAGCGAAVFAPMVVIKWTLEGQFQPWEMYARLLVAHNPGSYALEAYYHMWPVVAFLLFVAAILGGGSKQWYSLRGYWGDGVGLWCLLAWSFPFPFVIWGFIATYWR